MGLLHFASTIFASIQVLGDSKVVCISCGYFIWSTGATTSVLYFPPFQNYLFAISLESINILLMNYQRNLLDDQRAYYFLRSYGGFPHHVGLCFTILDFHMSLVNSAK